MESSFYKQSKEIGVIALMYAASSDKTIFFFVERLPEDTQLRLIQSILNMDREKELEQ